MTWQFSIAGLFVGIEGFDNIPCRVRLSIDLAPGSFGGLGALFLHSGDLFLTLLR